MSLDWSTNKCKLGELPENDDETTDRERLIWSSIAVDLGTITEANQQEWFVRQAVLDRLGLAMFPDVPKAEWVRAITRWEGLSTNVVNLSRTKWLNKVRKLALDDTIYNANRLWKSLTTQPEGS